jgi:formyltetrahydrofolate hydrolase
MAAALAQFSTYNFFGFFKKFDPHFADGSFIVEPRFSAVKLILIINEMETFLTVTQPLRPEDDWSGLFSIMNNCEGQELVNIEQFTHMITMVREIHSTKIIELMVQYTLRNPVWQWKQVTFRESIGEEWLEEKKAEADAFILKINTVKKNGQISALTKQIFEAADIVRLENYTIQLSEQYFRRQLEYFAYAEGLNYLKAFLDDYVLKEFKELCDILIIRGQWTNSAMSREMSEALHRLLEASEPIAMMDEALSEDGADGSRLRTSMLRIDRDQTQGRYINSIIAKNNEIAIDIINHAAQDLIIIGKHMKNLIDDVQKKHPELLINWRELILASKDPLSQRMITDFKRINYFVQLMQLCTQ